MEDWKEKALKYEKLSEHNKRILREGPESSIGSMVPRRNEKQIPDPWFN
jgi:hypothetical protein